MFEKHRCARCSLRRRAVMLLPAETGQVPDTLAAVLEAICAARTPAAALNWLRTGAGAAILANLAAGRLTATHRALDEHPRPQAASHLRHMLTAGAVLPPRDEELARTEQWLTALLASIDVSEHRRLVHAFATWQVMRRLRRASETRRHPRTYSAHAWKAISAAVRFLSCLSSHGTTLSTCRQADAEDWLATGPGACYAREFLIWAAATATGGPSTSRARRSAPEPRSALASAGTWQPGCCTTTASRSPTGWPGPLVLLFGQNMTRVAALTTSQVTRHDNGVTIQLGPHEVPVPSH
jgi:hypothetical protein